MLSFHPDCFQKPNENGQHMKILEMNQKPNAYPANPAPNQAQGDKGIELKRAFENIPEAEVSISKEGMAATHI